MSMGKARDGQSPRLEDLLQTLFVERELSLDDVGHLERAIASLEAEAAYADRRVRPLQSAESTSTPRRDLLEGHATSAGTHRLVTRVGTRALFYRREQELYLTNIGFGTCRGALNDCTDSAYATAITEALSNGCNIIDTAISYRCQRSERAVAKGVCDFIQHRGGQRDEIVVCTKGGFVTPGAVTQKTTMDDYAVGGIHSMESSFLADQISRSRSNLGVETIDVYYLHNPEFQLQFVDISEFRRRVRLAFEALERAVANRRICWYGTATWSGYRDGSLSLHDMVQAATDVAGADHHFRFVQLPFNAGMREAHEVLLGEKKGCLLQVAREAGLTVVASASLFQSQLLSDLSHDLFALTLDTASQFQRSLQFVRSVPGIASALVGMRNLQHVLENLALLEVPSLTSSDFDRLRAAIEERVHLSSNHVRHVFI